MIKNVRPVQVGVIPWGWVNKRAGSYVGIVEHPGYVPDLDLLKYFEWSVFELGGSALRDELDELKFCSMDMKCVFNMCYRFMGEKFFEMIGKGEAEPIVDKVEHMLFRWNKKLMDIIGDKVDFFLLGDDIAYNSGMMVHPNTWIELFGERFIEWGKLAHRYDAEFVFHSDGDISYIVDFLATDMRVDTVLFQRVGRMAEFETGDFHRGMRLNEVPEEHTHLGYRKEVEE